MTTVLDELPGTGGELARHLITRLELTGFNVEALETRRRSLQPGKQDRLL